jgi:hypothetical protein
VPNANLAESILLFVTNHDRAVSITGDLLELNQSRSAASFWANVARVAAAQLWRDIWSAKREMIGFALLCFVKSLFLDSLIMSAVTVTWMRFWPYAIDVSVYYIPPAVFIALLSVPTVVAPFLAAWHTASRFKRSHLANGVATAALCLLLYVPGLVFHQPGQKVSTVRVIRTAPYPYEDRAGQDTFLICTSVIAGSLFARARLLRRSQSDWTLRPLC